MKESLAGSKEARVPILGIYGYNEAINIEIGRKNMFRFKKKEKNRDTF